MLEAIKSFLSGRKQGVLSKIDLTFGGAGNQVMTIDGKNYATWIDYKSWPPIGATVLHEPYRQSDGRGNLLLATKIISWVKPEEQSNET